MVDITLTKPQFRLVTTQLQFPAMVAGFGAGKTHALLCRAVAMKLKYPKQDIAYYLPTYDLVRTIGFPRFAEFFENIGQSYRINRSDAVIHIANAGTIIFRTMDRPERIIGYEVADSFADELDTLKTEKAREVWEKIISRNRQKKPDGALNTVAVGTTPEGFRFVYERWHKNPVNGYEIIKATTRSNSANLPDGYIDSLKNTYPSNRLSAYLDGEFVNLTSGSVYTSFDRALNASHEVVNGNETLHIGIDFNVGKMASTVHVLRDGEPHAVDEIMGVLDTPAMIMMIKQRYEGNRVMAYPDASGKSRKSVNASESDLSLLKQAGFTVCVNKSNPAVKDRVLSVNKILGEQKYKINIDKCPHLVEGLEKQAYDKNGEPDKTGDLDHGVDSAGYFITYRYPVVKRTFSIGTTTGL
jgi:phage terminase large subunit